MTLGRLKELVKEVSIAGDPRAASLARLVDMTTEVDGIRVTLVSDYEGEDLSPIILKQLKLLKYKSEDLTRRIEGILKLFPRFSR